MPDRNPAKTDERKMGRQREFGPDAACVCCGKGSLELLKAVTNAETAEYVQRCLLERHHPIPRKIEPGLTMTLCVECHKRATERQLENDALYAAPANILEVILVGLKAVAAALQHACEVIEEWIARLEAAIKRLDAKVTGWRAAVEEPE